MTRWFIVDFSKMDKIYDIQANHVVVKVDNTPVKEGTIYLHWENINVFTSDTSESFLSRCIPGNCKCKKCNKPNDSKHIVKNGKYELKLW